MFVQREQLGCSKSGAVAHPLASFGNKKRTKMQEIRFFFQILHCIMLDNCAWILRAVPGLTKASGFAAGDGGGGGETPSQECAQ